ncbi:hypothetical protein PR001_g24389 [Phytophthora rubi]|uniref:Uncharacterized protein n=1 Tax=Phytophthora rubi TaxID=129364 RepID=A0A6A3IIR0_9STRA|nr:hypothetical protein PR001_g24389 [Phytophthora rubi]
MQLPMPEVLFKNLSSSVPAPVEQGAEQQTDEGRWRDYVCDEIDLIKIVGLVDEVDIRISTQRGRPGDERG